MIEEGSTTEENPNKHTSIEAPTLKKPRNLIIIFMLIGMCLASLFLVPRIPGLFTSWEKLPKAPVKPTQLLGTTSLWYGPGYVIVRAEGGQTYTYDAGRHQWYGQPLGYDFKREPCNLSTFKFFKLKRPFEKPFQCVQVYGYGDIAPAPLFTYVLDQNGSLWYWPQESSLLFLCMLGLSGALGLVAGVLLNFIRLVIRRAKLSRHM